MGDIINSRGLEPEVRERVTQAAKSAFERINTKYRGAFLADFGMVRGDSFEGVLLTSHYAPQIMMDIVKVFYRVEKTLVRISAVIGQLTVTSSDRNEVDGPAFESVMAALAKLKERGSTHWMQVSFDVGTLGQSLVNSQIELLTALTEKWTDKQREICWIAEEIEEQEAYPKDSAKKQELYKLIANKQNSTSAVVKKQLNAASYDVYRQAWDGFTSFLVEIDEITIDNKTPAQISYVSYLNVAYRKIGQHLFKEALPLLENALIFAKKELGDNDAQLLQIYNYLAQSYIETLMYEEAEAVIDDALSLQNEFPKSTQYILLLDTHSHLLHKKGNPQEAKKILEVAMESAKNILNATHLQWGTLYNNFASILFSMSDYSEAIIYYEKAFSVGGDLIDVAVGLSNIALCYVKMEKYDEAISSAEEALNVFELNLPPNHKYIIDTKWLLAAIEEKSQKGEQK